MLSNSLSSSFARTIFIPKEIQKEVCGPVKCDTCKMLVQSAENMLLENSTQTYLLTLCDVIPFEYKNVCTSVIKVEYPTFVQFIESDYTPTDICTKFKYCI